MWNSIVPCSKERCSLASLLLTAGFSVRLGAVRQCSSIKSGVACLSAGHCAHVHRSTVRPSSSQFTQCFHFTVVTISRCYSIKVVTHYPCSQVVYKFYPRPFSVGRCSLAVFDPRFGHTTDVLFSFICPLSFWLTLPRGVLFMSWCCPARPCVVFLTCVHLALFLALPLSPDNSIVTSWCDHIMVVSLLWQCLTLPCLPQLS